MAGPAFRIIPSRLELVTDGFRVPPWGFGATGLPLVSGKAHISGCFRSTAGRGQQACYTWVLLGPYGGRAASGLESDLRLADLLPWVPMVWILLGPLIEGTCCKTMATQVYS